MNNASIQNNNNQYKYKNVYNINGCSNNSNKVGINLGDKVKMSGYLGNNIK